MAEMLWQSVHEYLLVPLECMTQLSHMFQTIFIQIIIIFIDTEHVHTHKRQGSSPCPLRRQRIESTI